MPTYDSGYPPFHCVAEAGRCCMRARCVITERHLAGRRKSPVWSIEATYLPASTAGVPEEQRSAALITPERQSESAQDLARL
jgi:hypothetical protein